MNWHTSDQDIDSLTLGFGGHPLLTLEVCRQGNEWAWGVFSFGRHDAIRVGTNETRSLAKQVSLLCAYDILNITGKTALHLRADELEKEPRK